MPELRSHLAEFILEALVSSRYLNLQWHNEEKRMFTITTIHQRNRNYNRIWKQMFEDYATLRRNKTNPQTSFFLAMGKSRFISCKEDFEVSADPDDSRSTVEGNHRYFQFTSDIDYQVTSGQLIYKVKNKKNKRRTTTFVVTLTTSHEDSEVMDDVSSCDETSNAEFNILPDEVLYEDVSLTTEHPIPRDVFQMTEDKSVEETTDESIAQTYDDMMRGVCNIFADDEGLFSPPSPLSHGVREMEVFGELREHSFTDAEYKSLLSLMGDQ